MPNTHAARSGTTHAAKPFPWRCAECHERSVVLATIDHTSEIRYEGRVHSVRVPALVVPRCEKCGEVIFDNDADAQIANTFRKQMGLMTPDQIRRHRTELNLTQQQLANWLGVAAETISRWENGVLTQSKAMDTLLSLFFKLPAVRLALSTDGSDASGIGGRGSVGSGLQTLTPRSPAVLWNQSLAPRLTMVG